MVEDSIMERIGSLGGVTLEEVVEVEAAVEETIGVTVEEMIEETTEAMTETMTDLTATNEAVSIKPNKSIRGDDELNDKMKKY